MKITIIGSGPGLSRSIAHLFGEKGYAVTLVARSENKLQQEVERLKNAGIKADYSVSDISDKASYSQLLERMKADLPDVVVFNAFSYQQKGIATETWDDIKKQMDVNVGAAYILTQVLLPEYSKKGKGSLLYTGGGLALDPNPDVIGLDLSKAALRNLVQAAAKTVENTDIHIATVTVVGYIGGEDPKYAPDLIAAEYWKLHSQTKDQFEVEIVY